MMKKECMITNFLLENCSMGTVFDYDDETHIRIIGKALKNTPKELLSYLLDASENWIRCKNRNLAERLQDIFEIVYEDNQPFATKEECINDIEKFLNSEDIDYIDVTIYTLKTINNEYSLGIDGRVNNLIKDLEHFKNLIKEIEYDWDFEMGE